MNKYIILYSCKCKQSIPLGGAKKVKNLLYIVIINRPNIINNNIIES